MLKFCLFVRRTLPFCNKKCSNAAVARLDGPIAGRKKQLSNWIQESHVAYLARN